MTGIIPSPASTTEAVCEEVGNMAVCLFYLSRQANAGVVAFGMKTYQEHLQEVLTKTSEDESVFIRRFCKVSDIAVISAIQDIFYQTTAKGA